MAESELHIEYATILAKLGTTLLNENVALNRVSEIEKRFSKILDKYYDDLIQNTWTERRNKLEKNNGQATRTKTIVSAYFDEDSLLHDFAVDCVAAAKAKLEQLEAEKEEAGS